MYSIGIDIGGTSIKAAAFDGKTILGEVLQSTTLDDVGNNRVLVGVNWAIDELLVRHGASACRAIGIGMPGLVDADGHMVGDSVNIPGWVPGGETGDFQIREYLETSRGLPVSVNNDGNAGAYAEWRLGAGRVHNSLICISMGTGIGGGIVIDGNILIGKDGMAGEIGHIVVEPGGRPCKCGLSGCLERYSSATGIAETAMEISKEFDSPLSKLCRQRKPSAQEVYSGLRNGDPLSEAVHRNSSLYLARAVGILVQTLNPDIIVFSGGVADAGEVIIEGVREFIDDYVLPMSREGVALAMAQLGSEAGVYGAAVHAWDMTNT